MTPRKPLFLLAMALLAASGVEAAEAEADALLVLGPFSLPAPLRPGGGKGPTVEFLPELDVRGLWPRGETVSFGAGASASWRRAAPGEPLDGEGVLYAWLLARVDRFARVHLAVRGAGRLRLFVDGEEAASAGKPQDEATELALDRTWRRGGYRLVVREERRGGAVESPRITLASDAEGVGLSLAADVRHPPARYEELREVDSVSSLALTPDGRLVALAYRTRDAAGHTRRGMRILSTEDGAVFAEDLVAPEARPLRWTPDGRFLLLRVGGDLFLFDRDSRHTERVLAAEPGLGRVTCSRDGGVLVFTTKRGVVAKKAEGFRHRVHLREKLPDWPTEPHLQLLDRSGGGRRRLALPGDFTQDAFELDGDGGTLVFLRNEPIDVRPWFESALVRLDLASGEERVVRRLRMGFENRPGLAGFALAPDGSRVAFVGPPSELGDRAETEPNAFDPDLFVIDLDDGALTPVTEGFDPAVAGSLRFGSDARTLYFAATRGSRQVIVRARLPRQAGGTVRFETREAGGERIHDLDVAADGAFVAVVSSSDRLPRLVCGRFDDGDARTLWAPNEELERRLELAAPVDASFSNEEGTPIEGWLFRPAASARGDDRWPLIVYYYGGATPTLRGYNEFFQFLVANGYALFVLNPRGCAGYGRAFADHHVGDWGEKAGADILAGLDAVLAAHEDLDPERVGCFGGSFGGFMTEWLLTRTDRFAAAVSLYGISDIASYFGEGTWGATYGDQAMGGRMPASDPDWFVRHSPLFHADRIHTPLLLLHGDADVNVPPGESEQLFTELSLLGRPVEIVRFAGEDHGLRGTWEHRVQHREMLLDWFDRHLRGQDAAWRERFGGG